MHRHAWLWEPLESDPTFILRSMFGAKAVYLDGKLMLAFCTNEEPWRGVLVCTSHEHHAALQRDFPGLTSHPILPKWLYLRESSNTFDRDAERLVTCARQRDPRLGVTPTPKKKTSRKRPASRARGARP